MQAGLVDRKLTFRDVFTAVAGLFILAGVLLRARWRRHVLVLRVAAAQ